MAWIYLAESVESASPYQNGLNQPLIAKSIPIVKESCYLEYPIEALNKPPYGMILELSKQDACLDQSTSFMEDFHVKTLVLQDLEKAWQESEADCFSRSLDCVAKLSPDLSSWKMYQPLLQEEAQKWSDKLPRWGMIVDGALYPLQALERYISAKDGFSLPTIEANEYKGSGKKRYRGSQEFRGAKMSEGIRTSENDPIYIHPSYAEVVMGYPSGWSELTPWAIQWFLSKRKKGSKS